jgi:protein-disulfide isomerase
MRKLAVIVILTAALAIAFAASSPAADSKQELSKALKDNPNIILDFLREHKIELFDIVDSGLRAKQEEGVKKRREAELAKPLSPVVDSARLAVGKPDSPVTIVEYSDFLCPFCAKGAHTMDELAAAQPGRVRLIFKHTPHGETAKLAALYYESILLQNRDKAKKFHDLIFASQDAVAKGKEETLKKFAAEAKADMAKLATDMKSKTIEDRLAADEKEGEQFGFTGTPAYLVNGVSIRGAQPLAEFEEIIKLTGEKAKK